MNTKTNTFVVLGLSDSEVIDYFAFCSIFGRSRYFKLIHSPVHSLQQTYQESQNQYLKWIKTCLSEVNLSDMFSVISSQRSNIWLSATDCQGTLTSKLCGLNCVHYKYKLTIWTVSITLRCSLHQQTDNNGNNMNQYQDSRKRKCATHWFWASKSQMYLTCPPVSYQAKNIVV